MNKKKILIVCRGFYPDISPRAFRATELAKEFSRQGHEVKVLTVKNPIIHNPFEKLYNITIEDLGAPHWKSPNLGKSKIGYFLTRGFYRFFSILFEFPSIEMMFKVSKKLKKEKGYDLLISIAVPYPIHWGVARVWTKNQKIAKKWVADCGDPYMMNRFDTFRKPFYFKFVETWFSRKADYISIPRIKMINNFYPEFHKKIVEIPQGFRFEDVADHSNKVNNLIPTFGYAGSFIKTGRDPEALLKHLSERTDEFRFIVYTTTANYLEPYRKLLGDRLIIKDYIPRMELLNELSKMDFLINISFDPANQAPSKLIDYYLTKRPVLNLKSNQIDEKGIDRFFNKDYSSQFKFERMDNYRIENVTLKFLNLLDEEI